MMIPFGNLRAHHSSHTKRYLTSLIRIIKSGRFILGPDCTAFEKSFAKEMHSRFCVGCSSGTDALIITLRALGVGNGDEVIVPAFTFISTALAVIVAGARPVFVDVEPKTLTLDPVGIEQALTGRTKVIIPVHLYGMPADMDPILALAKSRHIAVVEDAAQAHGSVYKKRLAGAMGDAGCFSFYPSKNLGSLGDAGAVSTQSSALAKRIRTIANLGTVTKYVHTVIGGNHRMDTIQAAFLLTQLPHLSAWNRQRVAHAARYIRLLRDLPLMLPPLVPDRTSNMHLFVVRTPRRDALRRYLLRRGIETGIHYPKALHEQPALKYLGYRRGQFPVSEEAAKTVLSLPMYPELPTRHIRTVASCIRSFFLR